MFVQGEGRGMTMCRDPQTMGHSHRQRANTYCSVLRESRSLLIRQEEWLILRDQVAKPELTVT